MAQRKRPLILVIVIIGLIAFVFLDPLGIINPKPQISRPTVDKTTVESLLRQFDTYVHPAVPAVLSQFDAHPIVVAGYSAYGLIREENDFIRSLVPELSTKGVSNLAVDFFYSADQPAIDSIIAASSFDEAKVKALMVRHQAMKANQQQLELVRAVWTENHSPNKPTSKLRLLALDVEWDTVLASANENNTDSATWKRIFPNGLYDENYVRVIKNEVLKKNEKALAFVQRESSMSGFTEPGYKLQVETFQLGDPRRFARILAETVPGSVATILFHAPWPEGGDQRRATFPARGWPDAILEAKAGTSLAYPLAIRLTDGPFGQLDIAGTPYNQAKVLKLRDREITPPAAQALKLKDFAAEYVILGRIHQLHAVDPIPDLITEANKGTMALFLPAQHPAKDDPAKLNQLIARAYADIAQGLSIFKP